MILLDNVGSNSISSTFKSAGGKAVVNVRANDFGGGTVTIEQASANDSLNRFLTLENGSFDTSTGGGSINLDYLPSGVLIRAQLASSSGASNVFVDILQ